MFVRNVELSDLHGVTTCKTLRVSRCFETGLKHFVCVHSILRSRDSSVNIVNRLRAG
jgi:hypothetical protein